MCQNNVGVARQIDVKKVSADLAEFIKGLEREVHGDHVEIQVEAVHKLKKGLDQLIAPKA